VNRVPRWRLAAAAVVMAGLVLFAAAFAPTYVHNVRLQRFVADLAARPESRPQPDDLLRTWVVDKARELRLPVTADNVRIVRSPTAMRIDVRYMVRITVPGYTVDLHFYPGAGSH